MNQDFYKVLNVDKDSSQDDIKKAYRKMALKYHPDRNSENEEAEQKFKEVAAAYEVLGKDSSRQQYDLFGSVDSHRPGESNDIFTGWNPTDIFHHFFGSHGDDMFDQQRGNQKQKNVLSNISVGLMDIFNGVSKVANYNRKIWCSGCDGKKTKEPDGIVVCDKCRGRGRFIVAGGMARINIICPDCSGSGQIIQKPCPDCEGNGFQISREKVMFDIPPGCPNGYQIIKKGKGHQYKKGKSGDLMIIVYTDNNHSLFKRINDRDILIELPIPIHISMIGGKLKIPTLHGIKEIDIPQGIKDGQKIVYRGVGLPIFNAKSFGDMYIVSRLETPQEVSEEMREILSKIPLEEKSYPIYSSIMKRNNN